MNTTQDNRENTMSTNEILPHIRLMLSVKHPSLEECWSEGYEASQLNEDELSNPYSHSTVENEHWSQGWWAAYYGEEHLYAASSGADAHAISAANEATWNQKGIKRWAGAVVKIASAIAVSVAVAELLDMAV